MDRIHSLSHENAFGMKRKCVSSEEQVFLNNKIYMLSQGTEQSEKTIIFSFVKT